MYMLITINYKAKDKIIIINTDKIKGYQSGIYTRNQR